MYPLATCADIRGGFDKRWATPELMGGVSASIVTTNTTQTISGAKTFSVGQTFDNYVDDKVVTAPASGAKWATPEDIPSR